MHYYALLKFIYKQQIIMHHYSLLCIISSLKRSLNSLVMRLWFVGDICRYTNVFWLIDWLIERLWQTSAVVVWVVADDAIFNDKRVNETGSVAAVGRRPRDKNLTKLTDQHGRRTHVTRHWQSYSSQQQDDDSETRDTRHSRGVFDVR